MVSDKKNEKTQSDSSYTKILRIVIPSDNSVQFPDDSGRRFVANESHIMSPSVPDPRDIRNGMHDNDLAASQDSQPSPLVIGPGSSSPNKLLSPNSQLDIGLRQLEHDLANLVGTP